MSFLRDGLSIDESKISALIIGFLITLVFILAMYKISGSVASELVDLCKSLVYAIAGTNAINGATKIIDSYSTRKENM